MRLLIIEDNIEVLKNMKTELEKNGFSVDVSNSGVEGEEKAYINEYDLILLDLKLKDKNGIEIIKYLREENILSPVIIISGCCDSEEIVESLKLGADDYIRKPFELEELIARVNAVIRRTYGKASSNIIIGDMSIDTIIRKVTFNGNGVKLTSKEYDILEYLAIRHPAVISSEELLEHIYNEHVDMFSSVLRVHITKLRKKIKNITGTDILVNMRGKGYSLNEINS